MHGKRVLNWQRLDPPSEVSGHLAFYYSDQEANLPVRGVRKRRDNKADPNIETKTYGLFSTCMPPARRNMVERGDSYLFFFTNWKGRRILTGYYELGEYIETGIIPRANGKPRKFKDYALRARRTHFVTNGIPLTGPKWSKIDAASIKRKAINGFGPRDFKRIDTKLTLKLKELLDAQEDITSEYVKEIHRLEEENLKETGRKYPSWHRPEGFSENDIEGFIK